ncbi:unnamed protein product, partial [Hapterophycus canaliculatus]
ELALYFGLLEGNLCGCGDEPTFLAADRVEAVCDSPCSGDESETCGGGKECDLYQIFST